MTIPRVYNLKSPRTGLPVANQYIIETADGQYFQSYQAVIAFVPNNGNKTQLDCSYWDYSRTTSKYRNEFLRENTAETQRKIKSGEYELIDLN